ncbi:MAG: endoglucanase [Arcticibacterium sp.]|jgi:endoglucanase
MNNLLKTIRVLGAILFISNAFSAWAQAPSTEIRVNLRGYPSHMPKKAIVLSKEALGNPIVLLKDEKGEVISEFNCIPHEKPWFPYSYNFVIDFSNFQIEGKYHLELKGSQIVSHSFSIGPYPKWQEDVVGFIRTQRCGFNPYTKEFCHQKDGLSFFGNRPDSTRIDATGGWHDAGDQLKYLITGSNTTARMLMAYQMKPNGFKDDFDARGLKGSNDLPDILDEAKWGLEWILKLHPTPNELYHQVADDRDHRGFKLPHEENADYGWGANSFRPVYFATGKPQGLSKHQSQATGIANVAGRSAATLALAYQVFINYEAYEVFANVCLKAARELYDLGKEQEGFQQGNSFGAPYRYEENTWADDMEWAAASLYKITKKKSFLKEARAYAKIIGSWSWMERDTASHYEMYPFVNIGHYALWQVGTSNDKKEMIQYYEHNLAKIKKRADENPYGVGHLFIWCSNNLAAAVATQAMLFEEMSASKKYRPLMQNHVNWLLGLNPWSSSMITEIPENVDTPLDVHMPFWIISKKSIKGSLVDGPLWSTIHDKMLGIELSEPDEYLHLQPKHIKYQDDWADYSTNEPTLDGSAELLLILTQLSNE